MFNDQIAIKARWATFADYVDYSQVDATSLELNMSTLVGTANSTADAALKAWRWSSDDCNACVSAMKSAGSKSAAFALLGTYQYQSKDLPLKVAAGVAMTYLKQG